jgi:GNAT superfamily N-acetyltransferase
VSDPLARYALRPPVPEDQRRVLAVLDRWWGGFGGDAGSRERALLLPPLFFQHFADTSVVVEDGEELVAFMVAFLSASRPQEAYIHFVGVDPARRGDGLGRPLYERFFGLARAAGRRRVRCVTSPGNAGSYGFHTAMGFDAEPSEKTYEGRPVQPDHDGPGLDRICFVRAL